MPSERKPLAAGEDFDLMADACIDACRLVMGSGSPELRVAMRLLLHTLGRDIARRDIDNRLDRGIPGNGQPGDATPMWKCVA